jgi:hypothetical protein
MTRSAIACALAGISLVATGCRDRCAPDDDPVVEIGWGEEAFEPLDADDPRMEIIHGDQDGYHVPIALDGTGLDRSELLGSHLQGWIDGVLRGDTQPWVRMRCNPDTRTLQSWNSRLIWTLGPEELDGKLAHITVLVRDVEGREATAEADVTLFYPGLHDTAGP